MRPLLYCTLLVGLALQLTVAGAPGSAGHAIVRDEVELPHSDDDILRILDFPHVMACNLCLACVPHEVVASHPKAKLVAQPLISLGDVIDGESPSLIPSMAGRRLSFAGKPKLLGAESALAGARGQQSGLEAEVLEGNRSRGLAQLRMRQWEADADTVFNWGRDFDGIYKLKGRSIDLSDVAPGGSKAGERVHLPNCSVCWGCKQTLHLMPAGVTMLGNLFRHEPGGSPSWLFYVRTNKTASGWAIVKVWCVPVKKRRQRGLSMCSKNKTYAQIKTLMAQARLSQECGFGDLSPKQWIEPVLGVVPGHGWRVDWLGLWSDIAPGASVESLERHATPEELLGLLGRVNSSDIKRAAIFDLLFSQCDRHQQNLFITSEGKVSLIDNDQVYGCNWRRCGIDSLIVPSTQKFMINHLGFFYVMKVPSKDPPTQWLSRRLNPLQLLDYRCHTGELGMIGKDIPADTQRCMRKVSGMTTKQVMAEYGYPHILMADAVRNRSRDMLAKGYEWTLMLGEPTNQASHRYKLAPKCCSAHYSTRGSVEMYRCSHKFTKMHDIPFGNAQQGGRWHGAEGKDTGSYVGGTVF